MRGTFPLFIAKLDPLGRVPKMLFKIEVLHSGRIGHSWKIAATDDGSKITRALTVRRRENPEACEAPARRDQDDRWHQQGMTQRTCWSHLMKKQKEHALPQRHNLVSHFLIRLLRLRILVALRRINLSKNRQKADVEDRE